MLVGTLQTLGLRPPIVARTGVYRRATVYPTATLLRSSGDFVFRATHPRSIGETRPIPRSIRATGRSDEAVDDRNYYPKDANCANVLSWTNSLMNFAVANFLPIALVSGMMLGITNPTLGCLAHRFSLSRFSTFAIFIISGLMLRSGEIGAAIEAWPVGMLGLGSILFFSPFFSRLILKIQLFPPEFVTGLAIFCCMPTTLSSGVALTNLAGGNSALALAMTVISNLLGIIFVPFSLSKFIGAGAGVSIPTMEIFKSLVSTLLVPLILGKVLREAFGGVAEFVDQNRQLFSMMNSALLSLVPWIQVSRSRPLFLTVTPAAFAIAISMGIFPRLYCCFGCLIFDWREETVDIYALGILYVILLHLALLAFNSLAVQILSTLAGGKDSVFARKENSQAYIIVASQKTLPVMVALVDQLKGALGEPGLLVLPCVASHINQIIIDSFLVNMWLKKDQLTANTEETRGLN